MPDTKGVGGTPPSRGGGGPGGPQKKELHELSDFSVLILENEICGWLFRPHLIFEPNPGFDGSASENEWMFLQRIFLFEKQRISAKIKIFRRS